MKNNEQNEIKKNKKTKKRLMGFLISLLILIGILLLFNYLGLGLGGGKGDGGEDNNSNVSTQDQTTSSTVTTTAEPQKDIVSVKVSGSTYIYSGAELSLDGFKQIIKEKGDTTKFVVEITNDNAKANSMTALQDMLNGMKVENTISNTEDMSSEN